MNNTYWQEAVESALDDTGVTATKDQINQIAKLIASAHDMHDEYSGLSNIPNPVETELKDAKRKLQQEIAKTVCKSCNGQGCITELFGPIGRSSTSQCYECRGSGK